MKIFLSILNCLLLVLLICFTEASGQSTLDAEMTRLNAELSRTYAAGKYDEALATADKLVDLTKQKFGKSDVAVARALKNRGFVENAKGDTKHAEKTFEDVVSIFKKQNDLSKQDGASFAGVLEALAAIKMQVLTASGESHLELAVKWREKSNGIDAAETATALASLANIKYWNRSYETAAALYKRALLILAKLPGDPASDARAIVYARTECSHRKAQMTEQFASVGAEYDTLTKIESTVATEPRLVRGGVLNGKAIHLARPIYPAELRKIRAGGSIGVQVLISEKGEVLSACGVTEGNPLLIEASEIAAYGAKFSPTTLKGSPAKVNGIITYNYVP